MVARPTTPISRVSPTLLDQGWWPGYSGDVYVAGRLSPTALRKQSWQITCLHSGYSQQSHTSTIFPHAVHSTSAGALALI
jgi:hypothetical protein